MPPDELNAFRGQSLETASRLRDERAKPGDDKREQLEEVRESLGALRGSRLVRVTRPARKLYYRLRGGGA